MVKIDKFKKVRTHKATITMECAFIKRSNTETVISLLFHVKIGRYMKQMLERKVTINLVDNIITDQLGEDINKRDLSILEKMTNYINIEEYEFMIVDNTKREEVIKFYDN